MQKPSGPTQRAILFTTESDPLSFHELKALTGNLHIETVQALTINLRKRNPATYIGRGKVDEIASLIDQYSPDLVISNQSLSPRIQRNLESIWGIPVVDREEIILNIFSRQARTKEAKLQVELARLQYTRPRLSHTQGMLSQQRGGSARTRGAGEKQLELDIRHIDQRITRVKQELEKVVNHRKVQRKQRQNTQTPTIAIIGYTNSGKSSLLNALTDSEVKAENKLFATLDPTTRAGALKDGQQYLITDTVGFVSDLPHHLIDAFRSTLEESIDSDFLILLLDASHPDMETCYRTTIEVLEDLKIADKPRILFCNKCDLEVDQVEIDQLKSREKCVLQGSVREEAGLDLLRDEIEKKIHERSTVLTLRIPASRYDLITRITREALVLEKEYRDLEVVMTIKTANKPLIAQLFPYQNRYLNPIEP